MIIKITLKTKYPLVVIIIRSPTSKHAPRLQGVAGANAAGRGNKAIMDAPDNVAAPSAAALLTASGALTASEVESNHGRGGAAPGGRCEQDALPAPMLRPAAEPMLLPVSVRSLCPS